MTALFDGTAMREGRQRPSLPAVGFRSVGVERTAMREGRQRPSLKEAARLPVFAVVTAMREGRQRPSLARLRTYGRCDRAHRNEGGAPAPLVALRGQPGTAGSTRPQ